MSGKSSGVNQRTLSISSLSATGSPLSQSAWKANERIRKRPRLAREITDVLHPNSRFLVHLSAYGLFQRLPGLHEPRKHAIPTRREARSMPHQQFPILFHRHDDGGGERRIDDMTTGRTDHRPVLFVFLHGSPAGPTEAVVPVQVHDLERDAGPDEKLVVEKGRKLPPAHETVAPGDDGTGGKKGPLIALPPIAMDISVHEDPLAQPLEIMGTQHSGRNLRLHQQAPLGRIVEGEKDRIPHQTPRSSFFITLPRLFLGSSGKNSIDRGTL